LGIFFEEDMVGVIVSYDEVLRLTRIEESRGSVSNTAELLTGRKVEDARWFNALKNGGEGDQVRQRETKTKDRKCKRLIV
jgi:hypothetical protein